MFFFGGVGSGNRYASLVFKAKLEKYATTRRKKWGRGLAFFYTALLTAYLLFWDYDLAIFADLATLGVWR